MKALIFVYSLIASYTQLYLAVFLSIADWVELETIIKKVHHGSVKKSQINIPVVCSISTVPPAWAGMDDLG